MSEIAKALALPVTVTLIPPREKELEYLVENTNPDDPKLDSERKAELAKKLDEYKAELKALQDQPRQTRTLSPLTKKRQGKYELYLEDKARKQAVKSSLSLRKQARELRQQAADPNLADADRADLQAMANTLDKDAGNHMEKLDAAITAGHYGFTGDYSLDSMDSLEGIATMLQIMLEPSHPSTTLEDCELLMRDHRAEIIEGMREANGMGKRTSPSRNGTPKASTQPSATSPTSSPTTPTELQTA